MLSNHVVFGLPLCLFPDKPGSSDDMSLCHGFHYFVGPCSGFIQYPKMRRHITYLQNRVYRELGKVIMPLCTIILNKRLLQQFLNQRGRPKVNRCGYIVLFLNSFVSHCWFGNNNGSWPVKKSCTVAIPKFFFCRRPLLRGPSLPPLSISLSFLSACLSVSLCLSLSLSLSVVTVNLGSQCLLK